MPIAISIIHGLVSKNSDFRPLNFPTCRHLNYFQNQLLYYLSCPRIFFLPSSDPTSPLCVSGEDRFLLSLLYFLHKNERINPDETSTLILVNGQLQAWDFSIKLTEQKTCFQRTSIIVDPIQLITWKWVKTKALTFWILKKEIITIFLHIRIISYYLYDKITPWLRLLIKQFQILNMFLTEILSNLSAFWNQISPVESEGKTIVAQELEGILPSTRQFRSILNLQTLPLFFKFGENIRDIGSLVPISMQQSSLAYQTADKTLSHIEWLDWGTSWQWWSLWFLHHVTATAIQKKRV